MDPLDFRLANYAEVEPITGKPYSSKALRECYAKAATAFGWSGRRRAPRHRAEVEGLKSREPIRDVTAWRALSRRRRSISP